MARCACKFEKENTREKRGSGQAACGWWMAKDVHAITFLCLHPPPAAPGHVRWPRTCPPVHTPSAAARQQCGWIVERLFPRCGASRQRHARARAHAHTPTRTDLCSLASATMDGTCARCAASPSQRAASFSCFAASAPPKSARTRAGGSSGVRAHGRRAARRAGRHTRLLHMPQSQRPHGRRIAARAGGAQQLHRLVCIPLHTLPCSATRRCGLAARVRMCACARACARTAHLASAAVPVRKLHAARISQPPAGAAPHPVRHVS